MGLGVDDLHWMMPGDVLHVGGEVVELIPSRTSRLHARRFSRDEVAASRTRQWPIPGLQGKHQPISGGVENKVDLIGERRTAAGAIGGELCLMQLDQILGLARAQYRLW
jgi:hypothetical protein